VDPLDRNPGTLAVGFGQSPDVPERALGRLLAAAIPDVTTRS
jgi:hypothetical protein